MFVNRVILSSGGQHGAVLRKIISQSLMKSSTIDFVIPMKTYSFFIKHWHESISKLWLLDTSLSRISPIVLRHEKCTDFVRQWPFIHSDAPFTQDWLIYTWRKLACLKTLSQQRLSMVFEWITNDESQLSEVHGRSSLLHMTNFEPTVLYIALLPSEVKPIQISKSIARFVCVWISPAI